MKLGITIFWVGYLLGFALLAIWDLDRATRFSCYVGWFLCATLESVLMRRRFAVLAPGSSNTAFAIVLTGGFAIKLTALAGIGLLAHFFQLFPPKPFMLAFLAALVWAKPSPLLFCIDGWSNRTERVRGQRTTNPFPP